MIPAQAGHPRGYPGGPPGNPQQAQGPVPPPMPGAWPPLAAPLPRPDGMHGMPYAMPHGPGPFPYFAGAAGMFFPGGMPYGAPMLPAFPFPMMPNMYGNAGAQNDENPNAPVAPPAGRQRAPNARRTPASRQKPNPEPEPGVFEFRVSVTMAQENIKREFDLRTDILWEDAKIRACENLGLELETARLAYRITPGEGQRTKPTALVKTEDWDHAMHKVREKASTARVNRVGMEIIDLDAEKIKSATKGKKRARQDADDDTNGSNTAENHTDAMKILHQKARCRDERSGHTYCYLDRKGNHVPLDFEDLTFWAKKITLGLADYDCPPNTKAIDERFAHAKKRRRGMPESSSHAGVVINIVKPRSRKHHRRPQTHTTTSQSESGHQTLSRARSPTTLVRDSEKNVAGALSELPLSIKTCGLVDYPSIDELLIKLNEADPDANFLDLAPRLYRLVRHVDEFTMVSPRSLYLVTGITPTKVNSMFAHAEEMIRATNVEKADEIASIEALLAEAAGPREKQEGSSTAPIEVSDTDSEDEVNTIKLEATDSDYESLSTSVTSDDGISIHNSPNAPPIAYLDVSEDSDDNSEHDEVDELEYESA